MLATIAGLGLVAAVFVVTTPILSVLGALSAGIIVSIFFALVFTFLLGIFREAFFDFLQKLYRFAVVRLKFLGVDHTCSTDLPIEGLRFGKNVCS